MRNFRLEHGDIVIGADIEMVDGNEELGQRIANRLKTFRGEWYLDRSIGIPYFSEIFGKGRDLGHARRLLINEIRKVEGVEELIGFDSHLDHKTREFVIKFRVRSAYGETENEVRI